MIPCTSDTQTELTRDLLTSPLEPALLAAVGALPSESTTETLRALAAQHAAAGDREGALALAGFAARFAQLESNIL
jgi:hypothetical protein